MAERMLDTVHRHVLVQYPEDRDGFVWHHRLLVVPGREGRWVGVSPTHSVQVVDLSELNVRPLRRAAPFPWDIDGSAIFAFDPLQGWEEEDLVAECADLVAVMGIGPALTAPALEGSWFFADPAYAGFSQRVPEEAMGDEDAVVVRGTTGLAMVDGEWTFIQKVLPKNFDAADRLRDPGPSRHPVGAGDGGHAALAPGGQAGDERSAPRPPRGDGGLRGAASVREDAQPVRLRLAGQGRRRGARRDREVPNRAPRELAVSDHHGPAGPDEASVRRVLESLGGAHRVGHPEEPEAAGLGRLGGDAERPLEGVWSRGVARLHDVAHRGPKEPCADLEAGENVATESAVAEAVAECGERGALLREGRPSRATGGPPSAPSTSTKRSSWA